MIDFIHMMCLSFPEVTESPHFHKTSFRVKKKIFATLDTEKEDLVVKLSLVDQSVFSDMFPLVVHAVPGGWGTKGWTTVSFMKIEKEALEDILKTAYREIAPGKLADQIE